MIRPAWPPSRESVRGIHIGYKLSFPIMITRSAVSSHGLYTWKQRPPTAAVCFWDDVLASSGEASEAGGPGGRRRTGRANNGLLIVSHFGLRQTGLLRLLLEEPYVGAADSAMCKLRRRNCRPALP